MLIAIFLIELVVFLSMLVGLFTSKSWYIEHDRLPIEGTDTTIATVLLLLSALGMVLALVIRQKKKKGRSVSAGLKWLFGIIVAPVALILLSGVYDVVRGLF